MAKRNTGAIAIVGVAIIAVGGFFIFKALKDTNGKFNATVQFVSPDDSQAAQIVKDALDPKEFIQGFVNPNTITKPLICVGGAASNATSAILTSNQVFPEINESDAGKGFIFVGNWVGQTVYEVAGWTQADTIKAASWIQQNGGLPSESITIE